jgi:hypothetical protein
MIIAIVRFGLPKPMSFDEAGDSFEKGAPAYQSAPGLLRKHYLLGEHGDVAGGVYFWNSRDDADAFYSPAWSQRLAERFGSPPTVEFFSSPLSVEPGGVSRPTTVS